MHDYAQKNNSLFWNRKMIQTFIQLYKENDCLYDTSHQDYYSKNVKEEILKNILLKMRQYLPNLQLVDVQDKIKAICTQFSEEVELVNEAEASGDTYIPKLWCFDQLKFLRKHITDSEAVINTFSEDSSDSYNKYSQVSPTTNYKWGREDTKIFIQLLKDYAILYDSNHKDFNSCILRRRARNKLLTEARKIDPSINKKSVIDKIQLLRKQYKREMGRLKIAEENNETVTRKLWCFELLDDLYNKETEIESDNKQSIEIMENETYIEHDNLSEEITETFQLEDINEITDETTELEYGDEFPIIPTADMTPKQESFENVEEYIENFQGDKEHYVNTETNFRGETNKLSPSKCSPKPKKRRKVTHDCKNVNYEWIRNLVVAQLVEISPRYRTEFASDLQSLINKYVLKSKDYETSTGLKSSTKNKKDSSIPYNDVSSPSNVSFNIRFIH